MTNRTKIALLTASSVVSILAISQPAQAADEPCKYSALTNSVYCNGSTVSPATDAVVLGTSAWVLGNNGIAIGSDSDVLAGAINGIAIGANSQAGALNSTSIGSSSKATKIDSSALGAAAQATGDGSLALGTSAKASQLNTIAIGLGATSLNNWAISFGAYSNASAINSIAIGGKASSTFQNSTAIGFEAKTNKANQIMLGGAGSLVTIGDIGASTAAQNSGSVNIATVDANGIMGRSQVSLSQLLGGFGGGGVTFDATYLENDIAKLNIDLGDLDDRVTALENAGGSGGPAYDDSAVAAKNAEQDTKIAAVEEKNTAQDKKIDNHETRITTLEENYSGQQQAQSAQMSAMQSTLDSHGAAIGALQGQVSTLFDLANHNRKQAREANAGVALALAMDTPVIMPGETIAVSGGFGYWNGKVGGSASVSYRFGGRSAISAGVGIASTGKVGGRVGFRTGW